VPLKLDWGGKGGAGGQYTDEGAQKKWFWLDFMFSLKSLMFVM
jgi:hypothetical protein